MKILIAGGAGFIGKWPLEKFSSNYEIIIVDSLDEQVHKVSQDFTPDLKARATCIKADVQSIETYKEVIEGIGIIIHLAAHTGTGQSMYVYGWTKLRQEQLLQNYCESQDIDLVTLRFQNVYGPRQELENPYTGITGIFTNSIAQGNALEIFEDGLVTRDFVFVGDVADVVVKCVLHEASIASIINVGTGQVVTLIDVVETIADLVNKSANYSISGRFRVGDVRHAIADMSYSQEIFGQWSPTSLKDGLSQYLEWYQGQEPLSHSVLQESFQEMERTGLLLSKQS
jgi:nucleoside-diphosphate-sugar epimerase